MQGEMNHKFCTKCGAQNVATAAFCIQCGNPFLPLDGPEPVQEAATVSDESATQELPAFDAPETAAPMTPFDEALAESGGGAPVFPETKVFGEAPAAPEATLAEEPFAPTGEAEVAEPVNDEGFVQAPANPDFNPMDHPYVKGATEEEAMVTPQASPFGAAPTLDDFSATTDGAGQGWQQGTAPAGGGWQQGTTPAGGGWQQGTAPAGDGWQQGAAPAGSAAQGGDNPFGPAPGLGDYGAGQGAVAGQGAAVGQGGAGGFTPYGGAAMAPAPKKSKKGLIIGLVVGFFAVVGFVVAGATFIGGGNETVNVMDSVEVTFSGTDGEGVAEAQLNWDSLIDDMVNNHGISKQDARTYAYNIRITWENDTGLSNGDKFKVKVAGDDKAGRKSIIISPRTKTFTVSGLTDKVEPGNIREADIVGHWECVRYNSDGVSFTPEEMDLAFSLDYDEDGTVEATTNGEDDGVGSWKVEGDKVVITSAGETMDVTIGSDGTMSVTIEGIDMILEKK